MVLRDRAVQHDRGAAGVGLQLQEARERGVVHRVVEDQVCVLIAVLRADSGFPLPVHGLRNFEHPERLRVVGLDRRLLLPLGLCKLHLLNRYRVIHFSRRVACFLLTLAERLTTPLAELQINELLKLPVLHLTRSDHLDFLLNHVFMLIDRL